MRVRVTGRLLIRRESGQRVRYFAGDELSCSESFYRRHADILRPLTSAASEPEGEQEPALVADLDALRAEAKALGINVSKRWREGRLTEEIEKAKAASEPSSDSEPGDGE